MRSLVVGLVLAVVPPAPASIDSYLSAALESTGLPGVSVVVTHGDRIVHATGAGHDSQGRPVTADTPMRVASVSKSFTAAAVLTLVSAGKLSLDSQVPNLPRGVTVRHLLNQTSGIDDSSVDIGRLASTRTLAEYVSELGPVSLTAPPGTKWAYSNVNYDVAARLVEVASDQPFAEYMWKAVFEPLGMRNSSVGGWAADGYNSLFGSWFARPELNDGPTVNGAGAVVTTAEDMGRWLIAQRLPWLKPTHEPSTVDDYGMGWAPDDNGLLVHSGNLWTYNAIQAFDPETGYGYAVMTNSAGMTDDTGDILAGLVALTKGETPELPGGSRQTFEWILATLGLLSAALGTLGVIRARRWATRRLTPKALDAPQQTPTKPEQAADQQKLSAKSAPEHKGTPTRSRGRPALPVYRYPPTGGTESILTVDNRGTCGQLRRRWIWTTVRLTGVLLPVALFVFYPQVVSFISAGRTVLWAQLFYFALPLTVTVAVAAVAGLAVFVARVVRLRSVG
jgi:CubicO group peptidase (beta-lactamase class C family)